MCNCGKKRNMFTQQQAVYSKPANVVPQQPFAQNKQTVLFQYTGNTALTITGNVTRKTYRFNFPGEIQHIELSDAAAMSAVSVLKRI